MQINRSERKTLFRSFIKDKLSASGHENGNLVIQVNEFLVCGTIEIIQHTQLRQNVYITDQEWRCSWAK